MEILVAVRRLKMAGERGEESRRASLRDHGNPVPGRKIACIGRKLRKWPAYRYHGNGINSRGQFVVVRLGTVNSPDVKADHT